MYDDDSVDSTEDILKPFIEAGIVTYQREKLETLVIVAKQSSSLLVFGGVGVWGCWCWWVVTAVVVAGVVTVAGAMAMVVVVVLAVVVVAMVVLLRGTIVNTTKYC